VDYVTTRNLLTDSQDFERAGWVKANASIGNDVAQAPDGTLTADKLEETAVPGGHHVGILPSTAVPSGVVATSSVYVKSQERQWIVIEHLSTLGGGYAWFDVANGLVGTQVNLSHGATITDAGDGWYRCTLSDTTTGTSGQQVRIYLATANGGGLTYAGTAGNGVLLWGAQLEPGSTASDYVRTVDVVGKDYGWYEPTEGTVFADFIGRAQSFAATRYVFDAGFALSIGYNPAYRGGAGALITASGTNAKNQLSKVSAGGGYGGYSLSYLGSAPLTSSTSMTTIPTSAAIGGASSGASASIFQGHIKRLTYWPTRQSDSTLQVITQ
jgi:hypothetical protein